MVFTLQRDACVLVDAAIRGKFSAEFLDSIGAHSWRMVGNVAVEGCLIFCVVLDDELDLSRKSRISGDRKNVALDEPVYFEDVFDMGHKPR